MRNRWLQFLLLTNVVGFAFFMYVSNGHDWDFFLSLMEVDYRTWMVDGSIPMWSYQLCGGISRAGDPQAFGLSPLIVWVLAFGSFWGTKALIVFCMLMGWWFTKQTLALLVLGEPIEANDSSERESHLLLWVVAQMFVLSNFFLWHLHLGHVSFCLFYLGIGLLYLTLKAWLGTFRWFHWVGGILLGWSYYSAALFQSTLYFLIPLYLSMGLLLLGQGALFLSKGSSLRPWFRTLGLMLGFHVIGLAIGIYKLVYLFQYQAQFPRSLPLHQTEYGSIWGMLKGQLLPSWNFRFLGTWNGTGAYPFVWEQSLLNLCAWGLLLFGIYRLVSFVRKQDNRLVMPAAHKPFILGISVYAVVVFLFALGEWAGWLPHSLLRKALGGGIRVIHRYEIGFVLILTCTLAFVLRWDVQFRKLFATYLAIPCLLLVGGNFFLFSAGSSRGLAGELSRVSSASTSKKSRMTQVAFTRPRDFHSYMYMPLLNNFGVLNCYNPMRSERWIQKQLRRQGVPLYNKAGKLIRYRLRKPVFSLVDTHHYKPPSSCVKGSYYSQQAIHLDPSCPRKLCLNVSQMNLYRKTEFKFDVKHQKYCRE